MNEFAGLATSNYMNRCDALVSAGSSEREDGTVPVKNEPVEVSRRIEAPAATIFEILANPQRHMDFDGSDMLRGAVVDRPISKVGDTFAMKMHRLGDDYLMLNYVVEFEPDRRIFWEPAPGDASRAEDDDPSKVGIPAGYRWGYILTPAGDDATIVTEVFDYGRCRRRSAKPSCTMAGRGSTGPIPWLSPWRPRLRGSKGSPSNRTAAGRF
jgi:hypothetical protein